MKKILITGANSYLGSSFERYLEQWPERYQVDTVDMLDPLALAQLGVQSPVDEHTEA